MPGLGPTCGQVRMPALMTDESDSKSAVCGGQGLGGAWARLAGEQSGTTTLEWALLLAALAIPSYVIITMALETLLGHYRMMTVLNGLPFP